jgi:hypothetical protein
LWIRRSVSGKDGIRKFFPEICVLNDALYHGLSIGERKANDKLFGSHAQKKICGAGQPPAPHCS